MKKILFSLSVILLLCFSVSAQEYDYCAGAGGSAASNFCDTKSGYLICEDGEGSIDCDAGTAETNCRNTWTAYAACATEVNYAYTAGKLDGINSFYFDESSGGGACTKTIAFASSATVSVYARVKINNLVNFDSAGEYVTFIKIGANRCNAIIGYDGSVGMKWGVYAAATATYGTAIPVQGTEYHVWLDQISDTSCAIYVSETATKPAATVSVSGYNGVMTGVTIGINDSSGYDLDQMVTDDILIDDAVLGDR